MWGVPAGLSLFQPMERLAEDGVHGKDSQTKGPKAGLDAAVMVRGGTV